MLAERNRMIIKACCRALHYKNAMTILEVDTARVPSVCKQYGQYCLHSPVRYRSNLLLQFLYAPLRKLGISRRMHNVVVAGLSGLIAQLLHVYVVQEDNIPLTRRRSRVRGFGIHPSLSPTQHMIFRRAQSDRRVLQ